MNVREEKILQFGFKKVRTYLHDQYKTNRFKKGCLMVELTYKEGETEPISMDLTIDEVVGLDVSLNDIRTLDRLLNQDT